MGGFWEALASCLAADVYRTGPYLDVVHGREAYVDFLAKTLPALEAAAAAGTTVCGGASPTPTPTGGGGDACADVTEAEVASALPDFTSVTTFECEVDGDDRPWVGGTGVTEAGDANFILEAGGDVAFVDYTGDCANPPIPETLLDFCETS